MRKLLVLSLLLLGGCTSHPEKADINGIWINQTAIDAAARGRPLIETLDTYGPNLEWIIDTHTGKAQVATSFELNEGNLLQKSPTAWIVDYNGYGTDELRLRGKHLIQVAREHYPRQVFSRATHPAATSAGWGTTFKQALNAAYMGGQWKVIDGPGTGNTVVFGVEGSVKGLPQVDQYDLCMGGDCAGIGNGNDNMSLINADQEKRVDGDLGEGWIFVRNGKYLEIFQAINICEPDEKPCLKPGQRQWLLKKQ